jgi:hypothetical protein
VRFSVARTDFWRGRDGPRGGDRESEIGGESEIEREMLSQREREDPRRWASVEGAGLVMGRRSVAEGAIFGGQNRLPARQGRSERGRSGERVKQRERCCQREKERCRERERERDEQREDIGGESEIERERERERERIRLPEEQEATSGYGSSTGCRRTDFRRGRDGPAGALQTEL